jgi:signal transduction histidine kinase
MNMDTASQQSHAESLSALSSWERSLNDFFVWVPYVTLAVSLMLAQLGSVQLSERLTSGALVALAAGWTWLTFTRHGRPMLLPQTNVRIYFAGFVGLCLLLILNQTIFLIYGFTGFFHGALLRPWPLAFSGIAAAGFLVHAHIVITEQTPLTWSIYLGVVVLQTVAVSAGLYGGQRITEIAEGRREALHQLELALEENLGLHAQLIAQAREAGVLDERQRMAREIHDTIAQGLTGVITQLEATEQSWNDEDERRRRLDTAKTLAKESLTEARRSVAAIRPAPLEDSRLSDALADVAARWSRASGVHVVVQTEGAALPLRPEVEVTLLRAAQEGLANIAKHAAASRAGITLTFMDDSVSLDIRDDGTGFDPDALRRRESFGLAAMEQRVTAIHGELQIESALGDGTAISVRVPVARVSHAGPR